ncbi:MAG: SusD/RagB family nutrient-binding outer membrane lipoprotein [Bacteroidota bacterium]|nr:SusD/RagB family nutrient-binding outer membrane lipoprotein [Bacteroidota bacterium]
MKPILFYALILFIGLPGCKKMEYFQTNPNAPSKPIPSSLLTDLEKNLFQFSSLSSNGTNEGAFPFAIASALQYNVGFSNHSILTQSYQWATNSMDEYLQISDAQAMIGAAGANKSYIAVGKLFIAIQYYSLTNKFGDVPCSQAVQLKNGVGSPVYDAQKVVYQTILADLDTANTLLALNQGVLAGDFIYNGNLSQWRKFVNSFRLRVILSLSNKTGDDLAPKALFAAVMSNPAQYPVFTSNADNARQLTSTVTPTPFYNNPEYVYYGLGKSFADSLILYKDPRIVHWANIPNAAATAGLSIYDYDAYAGLPADASNSVNTANAVKASPPNSNYFSQANYEPNLFMGYYEVNFLAAEGIARGWWTGANPATYYNQGITASLAFYNIPQDTITRYLAGPQVVYNPATGLNQILFQRFLAGVYNSGYEPYFTQRRTGYPAMALAGPGIPGHQEPLRWQYPVGEYTLNGVHVKAAVTSQYPGGDLITEKMWVLIPE